MLHLHNKKIFNLDKTLPQGMKNNQSNYYCTLINTFLFFFREIQMATGEWIHDYLNRSGGGNPVKRNKSVNNGQRLYVAAQGLQPPSSVDNKRNIKRSWTISSKNHFCFYPFIQINLCQELLFLH